MSSKKIRRRVILKLKEFTKKTNKKYFKVNNPIKTLLTIIEWVISYI
jgi:hypothetical protein